MLYLSLIIPSVGVGPFEAVPPAVAVSILSPNIATAGVDRYDVVTSSVGSYKKTELRSSVRAYKT
jgi:hypothetical protein